ncbi:uncharacterized protein LOC141749696 isoform X3 [Larus michahellis]|uniref:uncharacterized protein LOC141749696 isoform X3 n=1 Tax=Larus michahellis TaxID=119627 RepID=UPI003D9B1DF6
MREPSAPPDPPQAPSRGRPAAGAAPSLQGKGKRKRSAVSLRSGAGGGGRSAGTASPPGHHPGSIPGRSNPSGAPRLEHPWPEHPPRGTHPGASSPAGASPLAPRQLERLKMLEIKERSYFAELPSVLQIEFQICRNLPREAATGEAGGSSVQLVSQGAAEAGTSSRRVHGLVAHQDFGSRHQTQVNGFWETHLWPHGLSLIASVGQELVRLPGRVSGPMCWRGCSA